MELENNDKFDLKVADKIIQEFNNSAFYREPTFFEITKFPHAEIVYSNLLAFYFNIRKEHQFGDLILRALLKLSENYKLPKVQDENRDFNFLEEQYYCERCFKRISQEEYELYDDMCEECFGETHYDFHGNPRKDYWNY